MQNQDKSFEAGALVRFINAPPRWKGDGLRPPGDGLEGKLAVILEGPFHDFHGWGGIFRVYCSSHTPWGQTFNHWGDFMEPVE